MSPGAVDHLRADRTRVRVSRLDPDKPLGIHEPKRMGDVGWDLEAMEAVTIESGGYRDIPVNARLELPAGFYADIRNRSSMSQRGMYVDHSLIDNGYRGPLFVFVRNMLTPDSAQADPVDGVPSIHIQAGERIGQVVFHRIKPVWLKEVAEIDLSGERGEQGFGSTGR
jgi:dUTPase